MRFPLKAIIIGILVGAALFFAPFGFPFFIFPFLLIAFLLKAIFFRRIAYRGYGPFAYDYYSETMPIDGYTASRLKKGQGTERDFPIN